MKKLENSTRVAFNIDNDVLSYIDNISSDYKFTRTYLINRMLEYFYKSDTQLIDLLENLKELEIEFESKKY